MGFSGVFYENVQWVMFARKVKIWGVSQGLKTRDIH